jgi:glycosyltransferase involved in cell wall biosynthesis
MGWNWAQALAKRGIDVCVLTRLDNKAAIESIPATEMPSNLRFAYADHTRISKILRRLPFGDSVQHVLWQQAALKEAQNLCNHSTFDVAHHVTYGSLHVGSHLWRLGLPFIFGPVGGAQIAPAGFRRYLHGGWLLEVVRTAVTRRFAFFLNARSTVQNASLVFVANRETEQMLAKIGAKHVKYMSDVALPENLLKNRTSVSTDRTVPLRVLWVARLLPRKALLLALEAVAQLDPAVVRLTVIGDGPQRKMVRKWIADLKINDRVEWLGSVSFAEAMASYDNADLFLFTTLRETSGTQIFEALGRGVPILTLDHFGAAILVTDSVGVRVPLTTPSETVSALAKAIKHLHFDRQQLLKMGQTAVEVARDNTWDRRAEGAIEQYIRLVSRQETGDRPGVG